MQDENLLTRENDEAVNSREARQRAVTVLLDTAQRFTNEDPLKAARFLNRAGRLQFQLNVPTEALATYQRALTILKSKPDSKEKIDALNGIGAIHTHLSQCTEAETVVRQAIADSERQSYVTGKAEALLTLSGCQNLSDRPKAMKSAQDSLDLFRSVDNRSGVARAYSLLGDYQMAENNLVESTASNEAAKAPGKVVCPFSPKHRVWSTKKLNPRKWARLPVEWPKHSLKVVCLKRG
jgi:tetratricopeptide (TPR) repeat protein